MDKFDARLHEAIQQKLFPGCVIGILRDGVQSIKPFGTFAYDDRLVTSETVYDLASITKSIPVATLASIFIDKRKCALTDRIKSFLPELQNDHDATVEDLLRYRVRGARMSTLRLGTFEEVRTHVMEHGFDAPPGERAYTNLPAFLLGIILERIGGCMLPALAHHYVFAPFGMEETTFFPTAEICAPTEIDQENIVQGMPHDESARIFAHRRRAVGHAGLFSTAGDLLKFASILIADPETPIVRDAEAGLGWQVCDRTFMGAHAGPKTFGKTGFTGTSIMIDIERKRALIILSNRTYPQRPLDGTAINAFRCNVADAIFAA